MSDSENKKQKYDEILQEYVPYFELSQQKLNELQQDFIQQIKDGLTNKGSSLLMLPTFITQLPNGKETGEYYALDLGGTNFRVLYVKLSEEDSKVQDEKLCEFSVDKEVMVQHVDVLFEFLAQKVLLFLKDNDKYDSEQEYTFGFCFSFPMEQFSVNSGKLIHWTKGYNAEGGVGADPVQLLSAALLKVGVKNSIESLLNDTVGVLAAERYLDTHAKVGLIVGTGCNACYVEKVGNIVKQNSNGTDDSNVDTIVDVEWGGYYTPLLPVSAVDKEVDEESVIPGLMRFEKLLAGMYIGEVARKIIVHLITQANLFQNNNPQAFKQQNAFSTPLLSQIDSDSSSDLSGVQRLLETFMGVESQSIDVEDLEVVKRVCHMVALRSAKLVAMAISALFVQMGLSYQDGIQNLRTVVAVDGGMYEKYEKYQRMLKDALYLFFGPTQCDLTKCVDLEVCEFTLHNDGSSMGAAVIAAAQFLGKQSANN